MNLFRPSRLSHQLALGYGVVLALLLALLVTALWTQQQLVGRMRQTLEGDSTMTDVVSAIHRVTDIMGEISAASHEQASGAAQVRETIAQMDQVTQQNAALVEQMAAAASSLNSLAGEQVRAVSVFHLAETSHSAALLAPVRTLRLV